MVPQSHHSLLKSPTGYMPQLDALRAIAVGAVILHHFLPLYRLIPYDFVTFGDLGVRLFFVLSGFLITGILLKCRDNVDHASRTLAKAAMENYQVGDFPKARKMAVRAQAADPSLLLDRQLMAILVKSLVGRRAIGKTTQTPKKWWWLGRKVLGSEIVVIFTIVFSYFSVEKR